MIKIQNTIILDRDDLAEDAKEKKIEDLSMYDFKIGMNDIHHASNVAIFDGDNVRFFKIRSIKNFYNLNYSFIK